MPCNSVCRGHCRIVNRLVPVSGDPENITDDVRSYRASCVVCFNVFSSRFIFFKSVFAIAIFKLEDSLQFHVAGPENGNLRKIKWTRGESNTPAQIAPCINIWNPFISQFGVLEFGFWILFSCFFALVIGLISLCCLAGPKGRAVWIFAYQERTPPTPGKADENGCFSNSLFCYSH